jgi:hypothetical protein
METLLDHHLATFDRWLVEYLIFSSAGPLLLAVVALLDQLNPEEYSGYWRASQVILGKKLNIVPDTLDPLDGRTRKSNIEIIQILSKFLKDKDRARSLWVNSQEYADLARYLLELLRDKWVYNPYTLICANTNS